MVAKWNDKQHDKQTDKQSHKKCISNSLSFPLCFKAFLEQPIPDTNSISTQTEDQCVEIAPADSVHSNT